MYMPWLPIESIWVHLRAILPLKSVTTFAIFRDNQQEEVKLQQRYNMPRGRPLISLQVRSS